MTPELLAAGGAFALGGMVAFYLRPAFAVMLEEGLAVRVADVRADQKVSVSGTLEGEDLVTSPLTHQPCLYWEVEATHLYEEGDERAPLDRRYFLSDCAKGLRLRDASGTLPVDTSFTLLITRSRQRCRPDANYDFYAQLVRERAPAKDLYMFEQVIRPGPVWICARAERSSLGLALGGQDRVVLSELSPEEITRAARWRRVLGGVSLLIGAALLGRGFV